MQLRILSLVRIVLLVVVAVNAVGPAEGALRAGAARLSIVPPFPTQMGGFFDRQQNFEGVHDEIFARALVLENNGTKLVLIGSDLMSVDADLVRLARAGIQQGAGIPAANILICCTHNHSAPSFYQKTELGQDDQEPSLKRFLAKQFIEAALTANRSLAPAKLGFAAGRLEGATRNRQQKNDLIDPQVGVLRVEELDSRQTIATLFNFTGHPVIIGSENLLLSGEYPGAASRAVENLLGGVAIFTQGACGDITVNRSGDPFQEIERLGRTVAGEVIKTSGFVTFTDDPILKTATQTIPLRAREIPSLSDAQAEQERGKRALESAQQKQSPASVIQLLEDKNRVLSVAVLKAQAIAENPSKKETELTADVQVLQIGPAIYAAIPGELFVEYALEIRSRVKQETGHPFCLIGYANGYLGYIVTPRAMETGGYEASVTRLEVLAGRTLTEGAMDLVRQLEQK
ncbi:MAG: neutral/alkaline non-lysosomal ceramidase N-terminal domain-containing protein [Planctomycetaceae bacterium]